MFPIFGISIAEARQIFVPYATFGVVTLILVFVLEFMFLATTYVLRDKIDKGLHKITPRLMRKLPHFDYFVCFLITIFIAVPMARLFLTELFEPFLLTASTAFVVLFLFALIFGIYFLFERKYYRHFKHSYSYR
ncbi:MAG TPA: hypothetical protein HA282_00955 [Nanoarchaeota archaeon]|nr:hypothetical protein [Candidatus Pacearchaeota archaeon]HIH18294.1 hypothetical protein [Nanoarchaeota archaeon]HIH34164.1 hypothetical protein [Nanoarchaeota archaeon]HIH51260.1 hypothetical protein [Nanoarchaeota archaeon]HIH65771.1 hypothetical protein [Nanoarchaeota archaeon]